MCHFLMFHMSAVCLVSLCLSAQLKVLFETFGHLVDTVLLFDCCVVIDWLIDCDIVCCRRGARMVEAGDVVARWLLAELLPARRHVLSDNQGPVLEVSVSVSTRLAWSSMWTIPWCSRREDHHSSLVSILSIRRILWKLYDITSLFLLWWLCLFLRPST